MREIVAVFFVSNLIGRVNKLANYYNRTQRCSGSREISIIMQVILRFVSVFFEVLLVELR